VTLKGANSTLKLPSTFNLHSTLLSDTTFHRETLDRLGLLKPRDLYSNTIAPKQDPDLKLLGLEFLSLLRTGLDIRCEYASSDELRRYRDAYTVHVLDYVL
jgi:hypothetical protein